MLWYPYSVHARSRVPRKRCVSPRTIAHTLVNYWLVLVALKAAPRRVTSALAGALHAHALIWLLGMDPASLQRCVDNGDAVRAVSARLHAMVTLQVMSSMVCSYLSVKHTHFFLLRLSLQHVVDRDCFSGNCDVCRSRKRQLLSLPF